MANKKKDVERMRRELMLRFPEGVAISRIVVDNVMRVGHLNVSVTGAGTVVVAGENDQGKSSFLDAFLYALCGKSAFSQQPIRMGEDRAKIVIELKSKSDPAITFKIIRNMWYTKNGNFQQNVEIREGNTRWDTPQLMLDALWKGNAADPLEFMAMSPEEQRRVLLEVANLTDALAEIDKNYNDAFENRKRVKQEFNAMITRLEAIYSDSEEIPEMEEPPTSQEALAVLEKCKARRDDFDEAEKARDSIRDDVQNQRSHLEKLNNMLAELQASIENAKAEITSSEAALIDAERALESFKTTRTELQRDISSASETVASLDKARAEWNRLQQYYELDTQREQLSEKLEALETELQTYKEERLMLFDEANFPIEHLSLSADGDTVMYKGLPLTQASDSERLLVSVALAMATHPNLRLIISKQGSLLGRVKQELLNEIAHKWGYQIFLEVVGSASGENVIVIQDGTSVQAD